MILDIKHLTKIYGDKVILADVDFQIETAEIIGLVAPNGSGKSTFFDLVTNLKHGDEGTITIFDQPHTSELIFQRLSYMQDNSILYPDLTAADHLNFVATCHGKSKGEVHNLLTKLGMKHYGKKKIRQFSLGMKQMLLLAMAIINEPQLLLLDEPINGLDVNSVQQFRDIMLDLQRTGTAIIMSSHNLDEIERITDKVYFLVEGELICSSDEELLEQIDAIEVPYEVIISSSNDLKAYLTDSKITFEEVTEYKIIAHLNEMTKAELLKECEYLNIEIYNLRKIESDVQTMYQYLFSRKEIDTCDDYSI